MNDKNIGGTDTVQRTKIEKDIKKNLRLKVVKKMLFIYFNMVEIAKIYI